MPSEDPDLDASHLQDTETNASVDGTRPDDDALMELLDSPLQMDSPVPPRPPGSLVLSPLATQIGDYRVTFACAPLGLTLETCCDRKGVSAITVTKLVPGGQAGALGVIVGDALVGIENMWVESLEHALSQLGQVRYPVTLVFRRVLSSPINR
jgi:hypothetical protein